MKTKILIVCLILAVLLSYGNFVKGTDGVSFKGLMAKYAGEYVGEKVYSDLKDEELDSFAGQVFGGTTNYDSLEIGESLTVTGNSALTGTLTVTATTTTGTLLDAGLFIHGGGQLASSTVNSVVLPSTAFTSYSSWEFRAGSAVGDTVTITLSATTTLSKFVPNAGDIAEISIWNSTTSATNLTLAGGTGSLLKGASTTRAINPQSGAILKAIRLSNTDIMFWLDN